MSQKRRLNIQPVFLPSPDEQHPVYSYHDVGSFLPRATFTYMLMSTEKQIYIMQHKDFDAWCKDILIILFLIGVI